MTESKPKDEMDSLELYATELMENTSDERLQKAVETALDGGSAKIKGEVTLNGRTKAVVVTFHHDPEGDEGYRISAITETLNREPSIF